MKHIKYRDIEAEVPDIEGIKDLTIRWLISENDGAKNFAMRLFEVEPGGYSPWHQHEIEHEMFILEGEGTAVKKDGEIKFKAGDAFFIQPWEWHNFKNTGSETLKFLCIIPYLDKDKKD
jgi:quercetin dioxygenase-like cupin family protein